MSGEFGGLQDLALVLIVAGLVTVIFRRFKLPVVAGYVGAGMLLGPHSSFPITLHEPQYAAGLAALGTTILMFWLGMGFKVGRIAKAGGSALFAGLLQFVFILWLGYEIGLISGWDKADSLFLGAFLALSSGTIVSRTLSDLGKTKDRFTEFVSNVGLVLTIPAVVILVLISGLATTTTAGWGASSASIYKFGIFLAAAVVLGGALVPRLIGFIAEFKSNDMLLLSVVALCLGFALLASWLGCSIALGAFIIGALVGEVRDPGRIEMLVEPIRDLFAALFFVSVGLLTDPAPVWANYKLIVLITVLLLVGKTLTCGFGAFVGGRNLRTSVETGLVMAPIGELSFVLGLLALKLRFVSPFLFPIVVGVSILTSLLMPPLLSATEATIGWLERTGPRPVINCLSLYTRWVGELSGQSTNSVTARLVRKWIGQMAINAGLIAVVFVAATCLDAPRPEWLKHVGLRDEPLRAGLWLVAVVLSLPLFIGTFQKLQVLGLVVAGATVAQAAPTEPTPTLRAVVAEVVPIVGMAALDLYVVMLGSALLPPVNVLIVLVAVVALISWLLWRSFIKVYARALGALKETALTSPDTPEEQVSAPLAGFLKDAQLDIVTVTPGSRAERNLIRQLALRTRTGATIVAIERSSALIVTPDAQDELHTGDLVLVLGSRGQLDAARKFLNEPLAQA